MKIWLDAHLSPAIASWLRATLDVDATHLRDLGLRHASDRELFLAARKEGAIIMTKDEDFAYLVGELGPPPQIVWLTCGNTSNARLQAVLTKAAEKTLDLISAGEPLVEISG